MRVVVAEYEAREGGGCTYELPTTFCNLEEEADAIAQQLGTEYGIAGYEAKQLNPLAVHKWSSDMQVTWFWGTADDTVVREAEEKGHRLKVVGARPMGRRPPGTGK